MDSELKRDLVKQGLLMLAAACLPLLSFALPLTSPSFAGRLFLLVMPLVYVLFCLFVLIRGSTRVIWVLPIPKALRAVLFWLWLILYPLLCWGWLLQCTLFLMTGRNR